MQFHGRKYFPLVFVILVVVLVSSCSDDSVSPSGDPEIPQGLFSGTMFLTYDNSDPTLKVQERFSVEVDSAGVFTISEETLSYYESYMEDLCEHINSGSIDLAPEASFSVENNRVVVSMVLLGQGSQTSQVICPDHTSELSAPGSFNGTGQFSWEEALGDGAYELIKGDGPPGPWGFDSFQVVLRINPNN